MDNAEHTRPIDSIHTLNKYLSTCFTITWLVRPVDSTNNFLTVPVTLLQFPMKVRLLHAMAAMHQPAIK